MARDDIPDEVRRFILTSIASVPYLEAMLLLRGAPEDEWDSKRVAQRLYVSEKVAAELLSSLYDSGLLVLSDKSPALGEAQPPLYCYRPMSDALAAIIDQLAEVYAKNLIGVTNLIHANSGIKVQQFADAFKWRKES